MVKKPTITLHAENFFYIANPAVNLEPLLSRIGKQKSVEDIADRASLYGAAQPDASAKTKHPKVKLTQFHLKTKPQAKPFLLWDTKQAGLALQARPNGYRAFKCIYSFHNRARWYHLGKVTAIDLATARKLARKIMNEVAEGKDPQAKKLALRFRGDRR
jgi:hypothetical protein